MIWFLLASVALSVLTIVIHGIGTICAVLWIAGLSKKKLNLNNKHLTTGLVIIKMVSVLLLLHVLEIFFWAGFYRIGGLLPDIESAVYFSLTSYTTVGYGDVVLTKGWRLLGPIESVMGVLIMGWSTGIMVVIISKLFAVLFPYVSVKDILSPEEPNHREKETKC